MRLIDIDRLKMIDDHIHYRKEYEASAILMDNTHRVRRTIVRFSIEYKPIGEPEIEIKYLDEEDEKSKTTLLPLLVKRISKLDREGVFADLHRQ